MSKPFLGLVAALAILGVAGCMEVTNSGVGTASGGDPLSGSMTYNAAGTAGEFTLTSLNGRQCQGSVTFSSADVSKFPLSCNDGLTGEAIESVRSSVYE